MYRASGNLTLAGAWGMARQRGRSRAGDGVWRYGMAVAWWPEAGAGKVDLFQYKLITYGVIQFHILKNTPRECN